MWAKYLTHLYDTFPPYLLTSYSLNPLIWQWFYNTCYRKNNSIATSLCPTNRNIKQVLSFAVPINKEKISGTFVILIVSAPLSNIFLTGEKLTGVNENKNPIIFHIWWLKEFSTKSSPEYVSRIFFLHYADVTGGSLLWKSQAEEDCRLAEKGHWRTPNSTLLI